MNRQYQYEWSSDSLALPMTWRAIDCGCLPHFHAGIELIYVIDGEMTGTCDTKTVTVHAGEMLVNSCYTIHAYRHEPVDAIVSVIPLSALQSLHKKLTSGRFRETVVRDDAERTLYGLLTYLLRFRDNASIQCGIAEALMGYLFDAVGFDEIRSGDRDHTDLTHRLLIYIEEHYREPLTVESLAETFGYSRSRFSHLFKSSIGYSLPRYLNATRVRHAAALLTDTDMTVTLIAEECGFNNTHTFYTAFRDIYDTTPTEYREANAVTR